MHLIILTQYYPPETGAPQNRLSDLARRLVEMGHRVSVLTAMPNYPAGHVFPEYRGKFYIRETIDGVTVHRSWILATRSPRLLPRLASHLSFTATCLPVGMLHLSRADFVLTESPPIFLGVSGLLLARLKGARFVVNIADLWVRAAAEVGIVKNRLLLGAADRLERLLLLRASLITVQTRGIGRDVSERVPKARVQLLTNGVDPDRFAPDRGRAELLRELGLQGHFVVGYGGIHGLAQALDSVVEAGIHLRDCPEIVMAFFGEGPLKADLQAQVRREHLDNVRFFPLQAAERMPGLVSRWGAGLVPLFDNVLGRSALPSKMFEIMASGVPVVLSAPEGEASALVQDARAGFVVEPENPRALAEAVRQLHRDEGLRRQLGQNGRAYVSRHFDRRVIAHRFLEYLAKVDGSAGAAPDRVSG